MTSQSPAIKYKMNAKKWNTKSCPTKEEQKEHMEVNSGNLFRKVVTLTKVVLGKRVAVENENTQQPSINPTM